MAISKSLQRIFQTDLGYLVRGGGWLTIRQLFNGGNAFVASWIFAHWLSSQSLGTFRYLISAFEILSLLALSGLDSATLTAVAQKKTGFVRISLFHKIRFGFLATFLALGTGVYYLTCGNPVLGWGFVVLSCFLPFFDAFDIYESLLQGKKMFGLSSQIEMVLQTIATIATVACVLATQNLILLIGVYYGVRTVLRGIVLKILLQRYAAAPQPSPEHLRFGYHLSFINVFGSVASSIDKILVFHFLGATALAVYYFASIFPEQLRGFFKNFAILALPKFSESKLSAVAFRKNILKKSLQMILFSAVGVVAYMAVAPLIFKWFFPMYQNAVPYSQVLAISVVSVVAALPFNGLLARLRQKELYRVTLFMAVVQILILLAGVHWGGLWGLVWARVITRFIAMALALKSI